MEQKLIACGNYPLSANNYPWLVVEKVDGTGNQTIQEHEQHHYNCRIPGLLGRVIRGHSNGWVILSNKNMWSIWKPGTCNIINLPPLILNNSESVGECCLSSAPDDPTSVLLLTITGGQRSFVFCQLGYKIDRLRWTRRPYNRQLKGIIGHYGGLLNCPTSYNGKIYALCDNIVKGGQVVIQVEIIVNKDAQILVQLSLFGERPDRPFPESISLLKGCCTELFYIRVAFTRRRKTLANVYLFKWVATSMRWEEMVNLKGAVFFIHLSAGDCNSIYYSRAFASELEGYVHIRDEMSKMMYSYDVEDRTISLSSTSSTHLSLWSGESSLTTFDDSEKRGNVRSYREVELNENESPHLLNLPFHLLEKIMDHCVGVEYMHFRATCKRCHLAANETTMSKKLRCEYSSSPWLIVVDKNKGTINLTDPVFGDKYYMKRSGSVLLSIRGDKILCSRFGWLLFRNNHFTLLFFNPFSSEIRKLPYEGLYLDSLCFSAPPTSPDCMVVGFCFRENRVRVCINFLAREQTWQTLQLDFGPRHFCCPTFCGGDLYALCDDDDNKGQVYVFKNLSLEVGRCYFNKVGGERICGRDYFIVKRDQQVLLVTVAADEDQHVEVFKLKKDWEKINSLGRYMIYIDDTTCLCIKSQVQELENTIVFPRLHSKDGNIVFYSLETCRYHVLFNGKNTIVGVGREHANPHAWIEPSFN